MKRNEALGTGLFAAGYLTGLAGFAALVGIVVITGCGAGDQGETTPDVAARLETQAREAAQQAKEAMEKAAQEGSDAASELAEA
ncbi:MAG: hypothetical protein HKP30_10895, partial [Myxococcales bacterium]|nr:hypothetical protein [Myxococcales bacterium]